jgi:2-succinyl-5-enolpyruvyl-6-hydroxy-3-cyclohexene-1-carboxylate synthase
VVSGYDDVAASLRKGKAPKELIPDLVSRIGETPTSKNLRTWLADLRHTRQIVLDPNYGWYEPTRTANLIVRAGPVALLDSLAHSTPGDPDRSEQYVRAWLAAEREWATSVEVATDPGENSPVSAAALHRALGESYRDGDLVYTASSLAIREQESFLPTADTDVLFLSNRGANGIDGVVASGIGAANATGRPTTVVTGDLGFQHDLGSLALLDSPLVPVRIVIVNDNGGRIFTRLPQKESMPTEEFDALMRAPGNLDIEAAAALFQHPYRKITQLSDLVPTLASHRRGLIEIVLPTA